MTRGALVAAAVALAAAAGVGTTQPRLASTVHEVKRDDIVAFPPPDQLRTAVLGWNAAAVDLLWASLLVEYGMHFSERRPFTEIPRYLDAILGLEPGYGPLYKYVDTMLAYRPLQGTEADVVLARGYLERGMRERPLDPDIWTRYGQFLAFVAPSFLTREEDKAAWRKDGALALEHAVELGADADSALAASSMLTRAGANREAIGRQLAGMKATARRDEADQAMSTIQARWLHDMPQVSRDQFLLLGPVVDAARCAGLASAGDPACARSWEAVTALPGSSAGSP